MIRERRSKEKLVQYYQKFMNEGIIDPNVHPWVAESWQNSRSYNIAANTMPMLLKLDKDELAARQVQHQEALKYLDGLYQEIREHFSTYNLSLLLLDSECYVLKSWAMPFFQKTPGQLAGVRLAEEDIGTSSISIAYEHQAPFLLFGPEMWIEECHMGDACSAPVVIGGNTRYIITLVSVEQESLPYSAVVSLMLGMKYAMESHLTLLTQLDARHAILDAVPLAVYHILPGGEVVYTNKLGQSRLAGIHSTGADIGLPNLSDVVLNYRHTPLYKGFMGIPSYNKEVTWITPNKTYEDITTVVPLHADKEIDSIVAVSLPIEDLRTLVAHAVGYTARYSLTSMVGQAPVFLNMKDRAQRAARNTHHILLQGEAGTGKQRLAHGIHQAGCRAAGPLIAVKCGDMPPEHIEDELFGIAESQDESRPGKLELANGGTLFLDEIEKITLPVAKRLTKALQFSQLHRTGEDVLRSFDIRIIAACDSDLKRLTEKGAFSADLYELLGRAVIRVPALRTRRGDIAPLTEHIIEEIAEQHGIPPKKISADAIEKLKDYDWPGNIKQLQGVVEQAFFDTTASVITTDDIRILGDNVPGIAWKEDREVFLEAWKAAGGNISRLANMLDVSRVTLYRYLKKYGLEKE